MNDYFYYVVPGILAFFVIWVFIRFTVKKDIDSSNFVFYLVLSFILIGLLAFGWFLRLRLY